MLSIRLQRTGRKGHAQYRVVVQDSHQSPKSGKFVARIGHYDPHTKVAVLDKEKATTFMTNGAQPSDRVAALFVTEKIDLPKWVKLAGQKERKLKNPEKLRRNQPKEEVVAEEAPVEAPVEEAAPEATAAEEPAAEAEAPAEEAPKEEKAEEPAKAEKADDKA